MSVGLSLVAVGIGTRIPLSAAAAPLWLLYCVVTGTIAMGCWVIAHECGHHAFHPNRSIEGIVGFALHSFLLVPYYSWAHSHAVHHAHCNHLELGETHVPPRATSPIGRATEQLKRKLNPTIFGIISLFNHLVIGWQLYLFLGATGGEDYDSPTSHFWNRKRNFNGKRRLFPKSFGKWMVRSNLGLLATVALLIIASVHFSLLRVLCVYGLPYLVINIWLRPTPGCSTRMQTSLTSPTRPGLGRREHCRQLTAPTDRSSTCCTMESVQPMCAITSIHRFRITTPGAEQNF